MNALRQLKTKAEKAAYQKAYFKTYYTTRQEKIKAYLAAHKEEIKAYQDAYRVAHCHKSTFPRIPPMLGKHHSEETKRKMSLNNGMKRPEVAKKQGLTVSGPLSYLWRGGASKEPYSPEWNGKLQEQIRNRDGYICQMPGCYLLSKKREHPVHHIDFVKKNNNQSNLITLCNSCHVKTNHGDRDYWIEFFQELQILRGITNS